MATRTSPSLNEQSGFFMNWVRSEQRIPYETGPGANSSHDYKFAPPVASGTGVASLQTVPFETGVVGTLNGGYKFPALDEYLKRRTASAIRSAWTPPNPSNDSALEL